MEHCNVALGAQCEMPTSDSFFTLFCNLVSKVVRARVSDLVAFILSAGSIFGLNKDEHSPDAQAAAFNLQPIQQGVGAPRGMEVISHVCSALYAKGYAILKLDATNGFQEIKRSSLHQAVLRRCPSLLSLFQKYYSKESCCFFDLEGEVLLLEAHDGARMGSFGFGLTVQDPYEDVAASVARLANGSCIKTATDDVLVPIKVNRGDEKVLYSKVAEVRSILQKRGGDIGISFQNDKGQLLLPKDWEPPDPMMCLALL